MNLRKGGEKDYEVWRLKMLNTHKTDVLRGFLEIGELLEKNFPLDEVIEILAKSRLKAKIKLKDLGYLALAVSMFHEKGIDFRFSWNKFWQGEDWALDMEISAIRRVYDPYEKDNPA